MSLDAANVLALPAATLASRRRRDRVVIDAPARGVQMWVHGGGRTERGSPGRTLVAGVVTVLDRG